MTQKRQEIPEHEITGLIKNRLSLQYTNSPIRIHGKIVNYKISLQQRIFRNQNAFVRDLIFSDCEFNDLVDIGDYESAGSVIFENCIFNNNARLETRNTSYSSCEFKGDLTLRITENSQVLDGFNVNGELQIVGQASNLTLTKINKEVEIVNQKINISASINSLIIDESLAKSLVLADRYEFNCNLEIKKVKTSEFIIGAIILNTEMKIFNCDFSNLSIKKIEGDTKKLTICYSILGQMSVSISQLNNTSISECSIGNLTLSDANRVESILNIEKSSILNFKFENLYNKGLITLRELKIPPEGVISFKSTNLGKADFIYCNFEKAALEFQNSKITEAFFSETEFPKKVLVNGKINFNQAQLTFGQLASAFSKQGDNIRALEYNSREVEAHYNSIKLFSVFFFRKINLWLNLISNNFGRDWVRGGLFSFGIGLVFFCLLLISTEEYKFDIPIIDTKLAPAYLKFMNPLRFFELENLFINTPLEGNIKLGSLSYLADFGGRIFVAYGYYQTIQAFRRFGRK
jgi:uncharacterized protein YjbI with pentapeptide repeats